MSERRETGASTSRSAAQLHRRRRAVARVAGRQHGVVHRHQLTSEGIGPSVIAAWVRDGRLHRVHRGVYAVGHRSVSERGRILAAVLACGEPAWASHRSAGALWEIVAGGRRSVEVVTTRSGVRRLRGIELRRTERLDPEEVAVVDGIAVTSPARTLADLAAVLPHRGLERAIEQAERAQILDVAALLASSSRRPGGALVRTVLGAWDPAPTRSELERELLDLIRSSPLPLLRVNARLGPFEVDQLWRAERVVVEADSHGFHSTRAAIERDRRRDAVLAARGYRVLRFTWQQVKTRPDEVLTAIRAALTSAVHS